MSKITEINNPPSPHPILVKMFNFPGYRAQPKYPPVNNDRDGESQDIDGKQSTKSSNNLKFEKVGLRRRQKDKKNSLKSSSPPTLRLSLLSIKKKKIQKNFDWLQFMEVLKYGFRLSRRSTSTWLEKISDIYLACGAVRTLVSYADSGENHQTPPETFQKTPLAG